MSFASCCPGPPNVGSACCARKHRRRGRSGCRCRAGFGRSPLRRVLTSARLQERRPIATVAVCTCVYDRCARHCRCCSTLNSKYRCSTRSLRSHLYFELSALPARRTLHAARRTLWAPRHVDEPRLDAATAGFRLPEMSRSTLLRVAYPGALPPRRRSHVRLRTMQWMRAQPALTGAMCARNVQNSQAARIKSEI